MIAEKLIAAYNKGNKSVSIDVIDGRYNDLLDTNIFDVLNKDAESLEKEGYIAIKREGKKTQSIKRLAIVQEKAEEFAEKYGQKTRTMLAKEERKLLSEYSNSKHDFVRNLINEQMQLLEQNKNLRWDIQTLRELLYILDAILSQEEDVALRDFSSQTMHNSKKVEAMLPKLFKLVEDEYPDVDEFLKANHIFKNPVMTTIRGNGTIYFANGDKITLTYDGPISLSKVFAQEIVRIETERVLSVENLTTFYTIRENDFDGLLIFLGGYSNNLNIELLKKTECPISHFGDLDANGFRILHNLQTRLDRSVSRYRMDVETFEKYQEYGPEMTEFNRHSLISMLNDEKYSEEEKNVFQCMLDAGKTLEQEIVK